MKISLLLINLVLFIQCLGFVLFQIWLKDEIRCIHEENKLIMCRVGRYLELLGRKDLV